MAAFVGELNELFGGFKERAGEVSRAFRQPDFAYVLVAAPNAPALSEARFFSERLRRLGMTADALVLNRVHDRAEPSATPEALEVLLGERALSVAPALLLRAQAEEHARALAEAPQLANARESFGAERLWLVPVMAGDVRGLSDLAKVSAALVG
jgi:anion-transporting  ArsA/GET3 family ATPase